MPTKQVGHGENPLFVYPASSLSNLIHTPDEGYDILPLCPLKSVGVA